MINEDYVSFEIAKLLKEKGFDSEECFAFYKEDGEMGFLQTFGDIADYNSETCVLAPTLQMAMKWLREVHKIFIQVELYSKYDNYCFELFRNTHRLILEKFVVYDTYEESCEAGIRYCLENLI